MKNIALVSGLLFTLLFIGCSSDDDTPDIVYPTIEEFMQMDTLTYQKTSEGLYYYIVEGDSIDSENPTINSNVTVRYRGFFANGQIFDQSGSQPISFSLMGVIEAWQIGVPLLEKGDVGRLLCPSELAYGSRGSGRIPPNTDIIFDIELVDFR